MNRSAEGKSEIVAHAAESSGASGKVEHRMPYGATWQDDGSVRFALWAPSAREVVLQVHSREGVSKLPLERGAGWCVGTHAAQPGTLYNYRIDDRLDVPDPASRSNPRGVHGPSEVIDPKSYSWQTPEWCGRPWREAVVYELHVGTFTPRGTFAAIESRLDALVKLGVTAIELMPIAAFAGKHGWGYDGVLPFAPHATYGAPETLKRLIDAAHARGLMMLLDVVYNHFGPDGNYLHAYAQAFFTGRHHTPWGDAINFDDAHAEVVRQFYIHNALYWLEEYRFDGLRIDAVHAIRDDSPVHFIEELRTAVQVGPGRERYIHLVLENHDNTSRWLRPSMGGDGGAVDSKPIDFKPSGIRPVDCKPVSMSQWNDDFHHALHVAITNETDGYYIDFALAPVTQLGRVLAEGFAFQGEPSKFAEGKRRGEPSADLPVTAFVNFLQTHDQVGNRAFGERLAALSHGPALRAAYAILLLAPQPPLLFMGEEYAASQPFLYFCDFSGELADAVTAGRRREFARFAAFTAPEAQARIPNPNARSTFTASRLRWSERRRGKQRELLRYSERLLRLRRERILPLIDSIVPGVAHYEAHERELLVTWPLAGGAALLLQANLSSQSVAMRSPDADIFFSTEPHSPLGKSPGRLSPWEVRWLLAQVA